MPFQIAIDGPVAAGKGTVAKLVAKRLKFLYIDTGAMYRAAALLALRAQISLNDGARIASLVEKTHINLSQPSGDEKDGRLITVLINDEDVSWKIRTEEISRGASAVAVLPEVRTALVKKQQVIAENQSVVMEGRDITFRVLPTANLKIYLTANTEERAKRRHQELLRRGQETTYEAILKDMSLRDTQDMGRLVDPLQITSDAWVLDTTKLSIEAVVDQIEHRVKQLL